MSRPEIMGLAWATEVAEEMQKKGQILESGVKFKSLMTDWFWR